LGKNHKARKDLMKEQWRPIQEFPRYEISNLGEICNTWTGKVMKFRENGHGVVMVDLTRDDGQYTRSVRSLVAKEFVEGETEIFDTVISKDGDQKNFRVDNLAWRPRWFANEYARQFDVVSKEKQEVGPIIDDNRIRYDTVRDVAMIHGVLMRDVLDNLNRDLIVFPTTLYFYYV
jgi:hypothetical protein